MLSEVQTDRDTQLPTSKSLLVVGDKESGKTTLIAKIQGNEDPKKGAGLEYHYIDVRDEYRDGERMTCSLHHGCASDGGGHLNSYLVCT